MPTARGSRRGRLAPLLLLGIGAAALLAAVIAIALSEPEEGEVEITGVGEVQQTFGGLRQDGPFIGSPEAAVTVEVFNDLQCSSCADWELGSVPPLIESLVRDRRARLRYRHFPMGQRERGIASFGAAAAALQDREWQYVSVFFANQSKVRRIGVTDRFMRQVASSVQGLDPGQWDSDRDSAEVERRLAADAEAAVELRLPVGPAVLVRGPGGTRKLVQSPSASDVEEAVSAVD
jgi:protein-disulfide isomerase